MPYPADFKYTKEHEWIKADGGNATIGITHYAQNSLGDIVFVDHPKYYDSCIQSAATFIIINKEMDCPQGKALLVADEPFEAYLKLVNHFRPFNPSMKIISETSSMGEGTVIMPNSYIGNHVIIGKNCIIHPNVTILDHSVLGDHVIIQAGTVIGSDAFYYNKKTNRDIHYKKMNSCGRVVIEHHVEIGSDTEEYRTHHGGSKKVGQPFRSCEFMPTWTVSPRPATRPRK